MYAPSGSGPYDCGLAQGANSMSPSLHWNATPGSFAENAKLGELLLLGLEGDVSIEATGGVPSTRTVGCEPRSAKAVSRSSSVFHVHDPSVGAEALIETVSVPPRQSSVVLPPPGFLNSAIPFTIGIDAQVLATQLSAALVVALIAETLNPGGMPIRAR